MTTTLTLHGLAVATQDDAGTEHLDGHVVVRDGVIAAVGAGPAPHDAAAASEGPSTPGEHRSLHLPGHLVTPGLVNTHHHFSQWLTRGLAQEATLFEWLTALYPVWSRITADLHRTASRGSLAQLALSGCTTAADHTYVHPRGAGDLLAAEIEAASDIGLRLTATRGSMDLGRGQGGLPPDEVVETIDAILTASQDAVARWHDPSPGAMVQIAVAPCSPFSVTGDLMREAAALARAAGVRLHTHGAETSDEEAFCRERFGLTPMQYMESLGWVGPDVWQAHCVHLDDEAVATLARTGTGVAHCPTSNARLGTGAARIADLLAAGAVVGLGVDGSASNEDGGLWTELRAALATARQRGGPAALTARQALHLATRGGARALGRDADLGALQVGRQGDLAVWDLTGLGHAGIDDPVAALVLGPRPRLRLLVVQGRVVVEDDVLVTTDTTALAQEVAAAARALHL